MRSTLFVLLLSSAAAASPLQPLADVPETCRALAQVPASAQTDDPDFAAHVSVANCLAEAKLAAVALDATTDSVAALDDASRTSVAILDDVIAHGDAHWKAIAGAAEADLYTGMIVRMRAVTNDPSDAAGIESVLEPWRDGAARATQVANR